MRFQALLGAAIAAAALFVGAQGCSAKSDADPTGIHCTPGANVFCRCADRGAGTKLCREDGTSFEACTTGEAGECVGGEDLTDPQTGTPVDPPPIEEPPIEAGPPGSAIDACPGQSTSIGTAEIVIEGDTTGAKDKAKGKPGACAAGGGGPDHIYRLQATGTGSLLIKVQGLGAMNPTIYLRSTCNDEASQLACGETTGPGGAETIRNDIVTGREYFLYVDGASATAGKYSISLKLTPGPVCGDGKIDTNEACDDGNKVDGDGCAPSCAAINGDPAVGGGCPGQPVHMWPGKTVTGTASTLPYGNAFTKTGSSCIISASDLNAAQDHVYAVTAHAAGSLKVTLTPTEVTYNAMLVARKTCTDPASQAAGMCANDGSAGAVETMTFPVTNNQTVFVAAEGVLNAKGSYTIKFQLL
jgi:cysteine-rich repeat protein